LFVPGTIGPGVPPSISAESLSFGATQGKGTAMSDQGDIEEVKAEVDRLKGEVERLEAKPEKRRRTRRIFAVVFVVIAVICASAATPGLWARRTVYDTNRFVAVVGPLAADPAIQQALATKLTTSVFAALDVQSRVESALSDAAPRLVFRRSKSAGAGLAPMRFNPGTPVSTAATRSSRRSCGGKFIVVNASGKSTLNRLVISGLRSRGCNVSTSNCVPGSARLY